MERTHEYGSAACAALGGLVTALVFLGLYAALTLPVVQVLNRLV